MTRDLQEAYREPLAVETFDDEVVITGPGPIGISMTASAAAETARRLALAARQVERRMTPDHPVRDSSQDPVSDA